MREITTSAGFVVVAFATAGGFLVDMGRLRVILGSSWGRLGSSWGSSWGSSSWSSSWSSWGS
jgi:hypothetical protein